VGTDKVEIIDEARRIGTYDVSAEAHQDCCTLFEPREPATHASAAELDAAEDLYDLAALVKDCVERAERRPPSDASRP
jgi:tRNA uracil 4-sulfurtransferase